jgi:hypothetical protein
MSGSDADRRAKISSSGETFSGRSFPALLSLKEPAIRMLKERYSETFAVTHGSNGNQIHLFIIKERMWALVWTFTPRDVSDSSYKSKEFGLDVALFVIEDAMTGRNTSMLEKIDRSVRNACDRIKAKTHELGSRK